MNISVELAQRVKSGCVMSCIILPFLINLPSPYFSFFLIVLATLIIKNEISRLAHNSHIRLLALIVGYIGFPWWCMIRLNTPVYFPLLQYIFLSVFAHDIGAYCIGKLFGKTLLAPTISPKKSWEGFIGGLCSTVGMVFCIAHWYHASLSTASLITLSLVIACCATLGDLFESYLKRKAHIKDAGTLLPGHGGLLDRFDSIIAVSILFYALKDMLIIILT